MADNIVCTKCEQPKIADEMMPQYKATGAMASYCRACDQRQTRNRRYQRVYGITLDIYEEMLATQRGVCAVCAGTNPNGHELAVDHDHNTGEVRGLLCRCCNASIGLANESSERLMQLAAYLIEREKQSD